MGLLDRHAPTPLPDFTFSLQTLAAIFTAVLYWKVSKVKTKTVTGSLKTQDPITRFWARPNYYRMQRDCAGHPGRSRSESVDSFGRKEAYELASQ